MHNYRKKLNKYCKLIKESLKEYIPCRKNCKKCKNKIKICSKSSKRQSIFINKIRSLGFTDQKLKVQMLSPKSINDDLSWNYISENNKFLNPLNLNKNILLMPSKKQTI
jgi:hypothetical protein